VPVKAAWRGSDICDAVPSVVLTSVTSSEPDDVAGSRDGNTRGDIQDASIGAPDTSVVLRAERLSDGPGRVYTLTYSVTDVSGNTASALGIVSVPDDLETRPASELMRDPVLRPNLDFMEERYGMFREAW
jgi:hypothetical protein